MHQDSRSAPFVEDLFDGLPPRYDRLSDVLSMGQDRRWRKAMVDRLPDQPGQLVLDVATGPAGVALEVAARRSDRRVVGVDLTGAMLAKARQNISAAGRAGRISLVRASGERLPFADATFDALTFTYLLRYVRDPAATLVELARVVRPGGVVASMEFLVPPTATARAAWRLYTRALLPLGGALLGGPEWWRVGRFLGPSIESHYRRFPVGWHVEAWEAAGLERIGLRPMSLGGGLVMWGTRHERS